MVLALNLALWTFILVLILVMWVTNDEDTPWRPVEEEAEDR